MKKTSSADDFLKKLNVQDLDLINQVRNIILNTSRNLVEGIKWNAPSYSVNGNDIITFNLRNYKNAALIFHTGSKGKDTHTGKQLFHDETGIIEWLADKRFVIKIPDENWLKDNKQDLEGIILKWVTYAGNHFEDEHS